LVGADGPPECVAGGAGRWPPRERVLWRSCNQCVLACGSGIFGRCVCGWCRSNPLRGGVEEGAWLWAAMATRRRSKEGHDGAFRHYNAHVFSS
jgi:hypothetical protein